MVAGKAATWATVGPAVKVFPTLARFMPTFKARNLVFARPGAPKVMISARESMTPFLYHDLGVCVFAGASVAQVQSIANLLKEITENGQSSADLRYRSRCHRKAIAVGPSTLSDSESKFKNKTKDQKDQKKKDIPYSYAKYRLITKDSHVVKEGQHDRLSLDAAFELTREVTSNWINEAVSAVQAQHPSLGLKDLIVNNLSMSRGATGNKIVHHTVNGPRRLNVDAHCTVQRIDNSFWLFVEMFSVGTGSFLGSLTVSLRAFDESGHRINDLKQLDTILSAAPTNPAPSWGPLMNATSTLLSLEKEIWASRIREESYPIIDADESSLDKLKALQKSNLRKKQKGQNPRQSDRSERLGDAKPEESPAEEQFVNPNSSALQA
ncbi:hypothetical protein BGZ63DRAFT_399612 [Mariannaea sp. PMI_226]|nr:hypothetical protein BGZ63DRAFT_399612 [Mariannaea sp. PMI_226]